MSEAAESSTPLNLQVLYEIPLQFSAVLGKAEMKVSQIVKLARGSVIELDKRVGDPVEVYINNKKVAFGEIVLIDDKIAITITEMIKKE